MAIASHLKQLIERHSKLKQKIRQTGLTSANDMSVHDMKRQKLKIKEEIERIKFSSPSKAAPSPKDTSLKAIH